MEPWIVMICYGLAVLAAACAVVAFFIIDAVEDFTARMDDEDTYSYIDPDTGQRVYYASPALLPEKPLWRAATYCALGLGTLAVFFLGLALWHWRVWPNW